MSRDEFFDLIRSHGPDALVERFLASETVAAFQTPDAYGVFRNRIALELPFTESVYLVGSGNWGYSLNPDKGFKPFDTASDIDVAIVTPRLFEETWHLIREVHRSSWYLLDNLQRQRLLRNGQNIYSGFVSPKWLPDRSSPHRFRFIRLLNRLSDHAVAHRRVTALYFKDKTEVADYYRRGFSIAKSKVQT
jgi:hypothetical protein